MATSTSILEIIRDVSDTLRFEVRKERCKVRLVVNNFLLSTICNDANVFGSSSFTTGGSDGIEQIQWNITVNMCLIKKYVSSLVLCKLNKISDSTSNFEETVSFHIVKSDGSLEKLITLRENFCLFLYTVKEALSSNLVLTIVCDLSLKYTYKPIPSGANLDRITESQNLRQSGLRDLYENQLHSDLTLKCGDKHIRAHKCVLATCSPVFRKMFEHDTKERRENVVNIEDTTPEAIRALLQYVYCGETDDLTTETRIQLHSVADKYDFKELRSLCSKSIARQLKAENACEVAILAYLNNDEELLSAIKSFFGENYSDIVISPDWLSLVSKYKDLAKELVKK